MKAKLLLSVLKMSLLAGLLATGTTSLYGQAVKDAKPQPDKEVPPSPTAVKGTTPAARPDRTPAPIKTQDPDFVRWRSYLNTLAQEARTVAEDVRPFVTADVAAAYWETDRDESIRLFTVAIDESIKLAQADKRKYFALPSSIAMIASNVSQEVGRSLRDRIRKAIPEEALTQANKDNNDARNDLSNAAREDVSRAASLAQSMAPVALKNGTAPIEIIFKIAEQDPALADAVYNTYLTKASADGSIQIGALLQLAGYALGYPEFCFGTGGGASWATVSNRDLKPDPTFAPAYLSMMYQRMNTIVESAGIGSPIPASASREVLFATAYLSPEIDRVAAGMKPLWQQLEQKVLMVSRPSDVSDIVQRVRNIRTVRAAEIEKDKEATAAADEADAILDGVDKITDTCRRDETYVRAVMTLHRHQNPARAESLLDKISDRATADRLRDIMRWYQINENFGKMQPDEIAAGLQRISALDLRANGYERLAQAAFERKQLADGYQAVDQTVKTVEKLDQPDRRAYFFLSLTSVLVSADPRMAFEMLDNAITDLNKLETKKMWDLESPFSFHVPCPAAGTYWGIGGGAGSGSIFVAFRSLVKKDLDQALSATDSITDKPTKLRAQAIVARAALAKYRSTGK